MKSSILIAILLGLFGLPCHAQQHIDSAADDAESLQARLSQLQTLYFQFTQTATDYDGFSLPSQQGEMWLQHGGYFYWESAAVGQVLVGDGQNTYFYDRDLAQVEIRDWSENPTENPIAVLLHPEQISQWFSVQKSEQGEVEVYTLRPLAPGVNFDQLTFQFSSGEPSALTIDDISGQKTHMAFDSVQTNLPISADKFHFDLPDNVEVILQ